MKIFFRGTKVPRIKQLNKGFRLFGDNFNERLTY